MRSHSSRKFPEWIPMEVQRYLEHTEGGCSIRQLARTVGCHASTILRQVRRIENRRDDPLSTALFVLWQIPILVN